MAIPSWLLTQIDDGYYWADVADDFTTQHVDWLLNAFPNAAWSYNWRYRVVYALANLQDSVQYLIYANAWRVGAFRVPLAFTYCNGDVDITLDDILTAMVSATPEQLTYFVGIVDAYRLSVWNKPFNAEFYAALARGFQ